MILSPLYLTMLAYSLRQTEDSIICQSRKSLPGASIEQRRDRYEGGMSETTEPVVRWNDSHDCSGEVWTPSFRVANTTRLRLRARLRQGTREVRLERVMAG